MNDDLLGHLDKIYGMLEEHKQEQVFTNAAIKRLESNVSDLNQKVEVLDERTIRIEEKTNRIDEKLDAHIKLPVHV